MRVCGNGIYFVSRSTGHIPNPTDGKVSCLLTTNEVERMTTHTAIFAFLFRHCFACFTFLSYRKSARISKKI